MKDTPLKLIQNMVQIVLTSVLLVFLCFDLQANSYHTKISQLIKKPDPNSINLSGWSQLINEIDSIIPPMIIEQSIEQGVSIEFNLADSKYKTSYAKKMVQIDLTLLSSALRPSVRQKHDSLCSQSQSQVVIAQLIVKLSDVLNLHRRIKNSSQLDLLSLTTNKGLFIDNATSTNNNYGLINAKQKKRAFAENLANYLLDPNFACKKPAQYTLFKQILKHDPQAPNRQCSIPDKILAADYKFLDLDPSNILRIEYVYISPGSKFASHLGHSLLRIVRKTKEVYEPLSEQMIEVGELWDANSHIDNKNQHLFLSFGAQTNGKPFGLGQLFSYLRFGLPGAFQIFQHEDIVTRYSLNGDRSIHIFPLNLSRNQIELLSYSIIELTWTYSGRYRLFSSNCASLIAHLISVTLSTSPIRMSQPHTPLKLLKQLNLRGIVDRQFNSPEQAPIKFPSRTEQYAELVPSNFKNSKDSYTNLKNYWFKKTAKQRFEELSMSIHHPLDESMKQQIRSYILLEDELLKVNNYQLLKLLTQIVNNDADYRNRLAENLVDFNLDKISGPNPNEFQQIDEAREALNEEFHRTLVKFKDHPQIRIFLKNSDEVLLFRQRAVQMLCATLN